MKIRRVATSITIAGLLTAGLLVPASAQAVQAGEVCPGVDAPTVSSAVPDNRLNNLFTAYGDDNSRLDDWTGADGTYSLRLKDGRQLWIFSDTFLGKINVGGTRDVVIEEGGTTPFLNNTFIAQRGDTLNTVTGGTAEDPKALMPPRGKKRWYWAGDANLAGDGDIVEVTYQEYERFGDGPWDWRWNRNVLARFSTKRLGRPFSVKPLPSRDGVAWGSGIWQEGNYTYIYGVEDHGSEKYMHLARVRGDSLRGKWQYYRGGGRWSWWQWNSARILEGVANEYSVSKNGDVYTLITHDTTIPVNPEIVAYFSCTPHGPFVQKTPVYTTPETGIGGTYENQNVFTYNSHGHPDIDRGDDKMVVSYNVNSFDNKDVYRDVSIYRPRFLEVTFE